MSVKKLYKIAFMNQGQVYEIYARGVGHGALFGFVEVEELVFGERTSIVVDPSEEKIKSEFEGVKRTYLPMHSILRITRSTKRAQARSRKPRAMSPSFRFRSIRPEAAPTPEIDSTGHRLR